MRDTSCTAGGGFGQVMSHVISESFLLRQKIGVRGSVSLWQRLCRMQLKYWRRAGRVGVEVRILSRGVGRLLSQGNLLRALLVMVQSSKNNLLVMVANILGLFYNECCFLGRSCQ